MPGKINLSELLGRSSTFDFSISENMAMGFAALTGDFSSLHTDKTFGRKSFYRKNVVHGMLLVSQLIQSDMLNELGNFYFSSISGKFIKPAFPDDNLSILVEILKVDESQSRLELKYQVANKKNDNLLCKGKAGIILSKNLQNKVVEAGDVNPSMLVTELLENTKKY